VKRGLVALLLVFSTVAYAGPKNVMVLKAEGTADAASRTTVETHVLRLAKHIDGKVELGDITLSDAAAAAGCNAADAGCKDEILATFAVDELVTTTVTSTSAGGLTVTVRRLQKGTSPKAAASTLPAGKVSETKIDQDLGPLFGVGLSTGPLTDRTPGTQPTTTTTAPPTTTTTTQDAPPAPIDPYATGASGSGSAAAPATEPAPADTPAPSRKWQKIGMGVGAGMILISFVLWTGASGKQEEIDNAPHDSPADFKHLQDLEDEADGLAGGGNLFFIAGVALTAVSAYYYWKKGRAARSRTAQITPTVFPHGAGVVLTWGGGQ